MNEFEGKRGKPMRIHKGVERAGNNRHSSRGAQFVEFALALPILLLLLAGIWDLGSSFVLKQKLTNAAREAARTMVSTPYKAPFGATGCSTSTTAPCAVASAATVAQQYLSSAGLNSSWFNPSSPSSSSSATCEWTYTSGTSSSGSGPAYELDIKGGVMVESDGTVVPYGAAAPAGSTSSTQITITWPLTWFASGMLPTPNQLSTTITMANIGGGCPLS
jgi:Flp pilus assembly protein TadG